MGVLSAGGSQEVRAAQGAGAHRMVLRFLWVSVSVPTSAAGKAFPTFTEAWSAGKGAGDGGRYSYPAPATQTWMELTVRTLQPRAWGPAGVRAPRPLQSASGRAVPAAASAPSAPPPHRPSGEDTAQPYGTRDRTQPRHHPGRTLCFLFWGSWAPWATSSCYK